MATVIVLLLWLWITSLVMLIGDLLNLTVGRAMAEDRRREKSSAAESSAAESLVLPHGLQAIEHKDTQTGKNQQPEHDSRQE